MEDIMYSENHSKTNNISAIPFTFYSSTLITPCEQLVSIVLNRTAFSNNQQLTPPYIRQLLAKQNLTLRLPKTVQECVMEFSRLMNSTNEFDIPNKKTQQNYGIQERSRSLIIFVVLIAFVSIVSIIGNLCLAKVIFSKRLRLSRTDRIVLCLALSELCLVLIDSPIEIYRFLSYSFSHTWLCRFHTFFESLFSSCIIFYHLLGAFDRFVYIHGHTLSNESSSSKWCRRISTKTGSIILLILPILCSLPISICNILHAHVLRTSLRMQICIIQYTHGILIGFLIFFYILPLLFSVFLHVNLIYFILAKHNGHYLTPTSFRSPMKRNNTLSTQVTVQKKRIEHNERIIIDDSQLLNGKRINKHMRNRQNAMYNIDVLANPNDVANSSNAIDQHARIHTLSNPTILSHSYARTSFVSTPSPIILYANNTRANANAKRTVFLLVSLFSFYVLCWAPYNIYTWRHAYQLTTKTQIQMLSNRTLLSDFNQTNISLKYNLHAGLRRFIFINYSLYLLSMISMCFSFIFYFSLNKQARHEFSQMIGCICPRAIVRSKENPRPQCKGTRYLQYQAKQGKNYQQNNQMLSQPRNNRQQRKATNAYQIVLPTTPMLKQNHEKHKYFSTVL